MGIERDIKESSMDYSNYTLKDLRKLKEKWYKDAKNSGFIRKVAMVGRELGEQQKNERYGPKYYFESDGLRIFVDDYGNYFTAHYNGKRVCSSHSTDRIFVPGEWTKIIDKLSVTAEQVIAGRKSEEEELEKKKLAEELGINISK